MKIYAPKDYFKYSSELIILSGLLDSLPNEGIHCYNQNKISRYNGLIDYCKQVYIYTDSIQDCDIVVLPYKFKNTHDEVYKNLVSLSKKYNKKLYCFYNDDKDAQFNIDDNVILFRTSFYLSTKLKNERGLIAFSPDFFNNKYIKDNKLSIGYCGHVMHNRKYYLSLLLKSDIETKFIFRAGFWAPGIDKKTARNEYFNNMEENLFTFCYRGAGNFSYRFYETLMMGRIPILVNTDCVIPFWNIINKENIGIIIDENDLKNNKKDFITEITNYYNKHKNNLIDIQKNNRKIWEQYFSPIGYLQNINNL